MRLVYVNSYDRNVKSQLCFYYMKLTEQLHNESYLLTVMVTISELLKEVNITDCNKLR